MNVPDIDFNPTSRCENSTELVQFNSTVSIKHTIPLGEDGLPQKTYSSEFIEEYLWNKLDEHYGTDIRKLYPLT